MASFWKIGVWLPTPNPHFRKPSRFVTKVGATYTSGNVLEIKADAYFMQGIRAGDVVRVVSSYSGFKGTIQYLRVEQVLNNTQLQFTKPTNTVKFNINDDVVAWTTNLPQGWNGCSNWKSLGIVHDNLDYPFDNHAWRLGAPPALNTLAWYWCKNNCMKFLQGVVYHCSVIYKGVSSLNCKVDVGKNNAAFVTVNLGAGLMGVPWTEVYASGNSGTNAPDFAGGILNLLLSRSATTLFGSLYLKTLVVCHAANTSQEANGVYTLAYYPSSVSTKFAEEDKVVIDLEELKRGVSYLGGGTMQLTANFEDVPQTVLDDFALLDDWQRQGNMLCLNPVGFFAVPIWLIGRMEIRSVSRDLETNLVSFNLIFDELI